MQRRLQQWAYRPEGPTEPLVLRTTDLMRSALILSKNTGWTLGHCRPDKKDVRVVQEGAFSLMIPIQLVRKNHLGQKGHLWTARGPPLLVLDNRSKAAPVFPANIRLAKVLVRLSIFL